MVDYAVGNSRAAKEIERAVSGALAQVKPSALPEGEKIQIAFLIVREKLDRMEASGDYDDIDVTDRHVTDAVITEIAQRLGHAVISMEMDFPEDLPNIAKNGFALVA